MQIMCTRLKVATMYVTPGMVLQYKTLSAIKSGMFGINQGSIPNARQDKLPTTWARFFANNRAVVEVEGFKEHGIGFGKPDKMGKIAAIYDDEGSIAIITTDSMPEVAKVHGRMPAFIEDEKAWLERGELKLADSDIQQKMI